VLNNSCSLFSLSPKQPPGRGPPCWEIWEMGGVVCVLIRNPTTACGMRARFENNECEQYRS
jgi:hypothetical protein